MCLLFCSQSQLLDEKKAEEQAHAALCEATEAQDKMQKYQALLQHAQDKKKGTKHSSTDLSRKSGKPALPLGGKGPMPMRKAGGAPNVPEELEEKIRALEIRIPDFYRGQRKKNGYFLEFEETPFGADGQRRTRGMEEMKNVVKLKRLLHRRFQIHRVSLGTFRSF